VLLTRSDETKGSASGSSAGALLNLEDIGVHSTDVI
jgi:hypothetical protein